MTVQHILIKKFVIFGITLPPFWTMFQNWTAKQFAYRNCFVDRLSISLQHEIDMKFKARLDRKSKQILVTKCNI